MRVFAGGATDIGKKRATNEDAFLVDVRLGLFAVADGMGGANAGELASQLALKTLYSRVSRSDGRDAKQVLHEAILAANEAVLKAAANDPSKAKMGTTITALLLDEGRAVVGHVGDSRLYRVRWEQIAKLTDDHTAVQALVDAGIVEESEAPAHPWAHILSRVIGREDLQVQIRVVDVVPGDRFVLCSDGFSDSLRDPQFLLGWSAARPVDAAQALVARAVELDGRDNATAVVVAIGEEDERAEKRSIWQRFEDLVAEALGERSAT